MQIALQEAQVAYDTGEIPVGAVIVANNKIICKAHNEVERLKDPMAHAEIIAITVALEYFDTKYLDSCSIYVSLEPCPLCASAMQLTRIGKLIYSASDTKNGYSKYTPTLLHRKTIVKSGIMEAESIELLKNFFESKR
ncbi:MAG: tRNA(adenine34) deaminase [Rikenellaceae bacterium]|nr:tRNA(adenine34) deaminase [Rikenellaceae bacterium]MDN5356759.1 tRNA(adenine34) deaminase [Rikenellaceae bacterium]